MIGNGVREKLAKASLAKANSLTFTVEGVYEDDRQKFQAMAQDLGITFDANNNILSNTVKADIVDHESRITSLESVTGFTGTIEVVTGVDFVNQTTETKTVTVQDGIVVGVV